MPSVPAVLAAVVRIDRSKLAFDVGARCAIGVTIVLVAGELLGHPTQGVTAAVGAINGGFASFQGSYRSRAGAILAASTGSAFAAFVGCTLGHVLGADVVVTGLVGFAAGLAVAMGPIPAVVGLQTVVSLVVFSQFDFTPLVAAGVAALVFAGGVAQMLLVVVVWPLRRFPEERRALGGAFGRLADHARTMISDPAALIEVGAFGDLGKVLRDPQPFAGGTEIAAHRGLAAQAERIRLELVAIGRNRQRLARLDARRGPGPSAPAAIDALLQLVASVLDEVAAAVREARMAGDWSGERRLVESSLSALKRAAAESSDPAERVLMEGAYASAEALAGQLRSVLRLAAVPAGGDPGALEEAAVTGEVPRRRPALPVVRDLQWLREQMATLRANLDLRSEAFRHGVRVGAALVVGVGVSHFFEQGHRYWLPMTVMIVLKPDFSSTFTRGVSRVMGTLVGAGVVTVAVAELGPGHGALVAMVVVFYLAAIGLLLANYAVYSVCIASLVVTLLAFTGQPESSVAGERSLYTVLGAAVALVAYAAWPTWAASALPERLSQLVVTEGRYGALVLAAWADPSCADRGALQRARVDARLARTNAEAAVERWQSEPARRAPLSADTALGVLVAVRAYVQAVLSLHAQLPDAAGQRPWAALLASQVEEALRAAAESIAGGSKRALPPLRETQLGLRRRSGLEVATPAAPPDKLSVLLVAESDQIVNSVNTVGHLVGLRGPAVRA